MTPANYIFITTVYFRLLNRQNVFGYWTTKIVQIVLKQTRNQYTGIFGKPLKSHLWKNLLRDVDCFSQDEQHRHIMVKQHKIQSTVMLVKIWQHIHPSPTSHRKQSMSPFMVTAAHGLVECLYPHALQTRGWAYYWVNKEWKTRFLFLGFVFRQPVLLQPFQSVRPPFLECEKGLVL